MYTFVNSLLLLERRKENNISRLLWEESYQVLTVTCILQGANMGKGYSFFPNLWDWETHRKQSKKNWKQQGAHLWNIFLALKKKFCICNMLYIHVSYTSWLVFFGGFNFCNFFSLYINSYNLRTRPAKWLPQLRKTTYMEI